MRQSAAALSLLPALAPALLAMMSISVLAVALAPARAKEPLQAYAWEGRPLLIFAPGDGDPRLARQRKLLEAEAAGMAERDMPLILAVGDKATVDGRDAPFSASALRAAYGVPDSVFALLLVGKDTGVKLRAADVVEPGTVFALIDGMPMRQAEMRRRRREE